ncbi:hypothetical protein SLEP1_g44617 [Rubroshorea leprosula]|uniref:Uncharacterized protein n=1 Tax=Rubroshorea leprosula TaxID=152421 RepID=A0AAV5LI21_9ROSI|nr:hypothetical protein SLEP1_g44617 [Rubroshorea leprosula]
MMTASAVVPPSLSIPVKTRGLIKWQTKHTCCNPASLPMRLQPFSAGGIQGKVCLSHPVGLGLQLQPISRKRKMQCIRANSNSHSSGTNNHPSSHSCK